MRLTLCEAPTQGVVTARVRYVPSGSLTSYRINFMYKLGNIVVSANVVQLHMADATEARK